MTSTVIKEAIDQLALEIHLRQNALIALRRLCPTTGKTKWRKGRAGTAVHSTSEAP